MARTDTVRVDQASSPAVFLDKDGTLVEDEPFNVDIEKLRIYPEVPAALARLQAAGYKLLVVSNQPGIAHGYFDATAVQEVGKELRRRLQESDVKLEGFYFCPHHPEGEDSRYAFACDCRKPAEGLLRRAADENGIDLEASWMLGDILNDVEAGSRAGCRSILVDRGNETEWIDGPGRRPHRTVFNLADAAQWILAHSHRKLKETE